MILEKELGTYSRSVVHLRGSFQSTGAAPTVIRDGKTNMFTVARTSAGLFTVTIAAGFPIPKLLTTESAHLSSSATPTVIAQANIVVGSYSQSARTFQIVVYHTSGTPGVGDPDSGDRINFELVGSINSAGTDPA